MSGLDARPGSIDSPIPPHRAAPDKGFPTPRWPPARPAPGRELLKFIRRAVERFAQYA
jgi:hypothetical protein